MNQKRLIAYLVALGVAFGALAYSSTQTINTLPSADSNFLSNTTKFMSGELPQYMQLKEMVANIYSGGTASTSANLTHTISAVTGFPNHYFATQAATAHTYTANTRTFVYLMDDDARTITIAAATITYSTRMAFAEMAAGTAQPATPTGCIPLMQVDTGAATISAVADLRPAQVYFVYRDTYGTIGGASAFVTPKGVTVFQVNADGSVSMYATTYTNMPSGTTVSGKAGEILVIPHGGDALNTVSGMSHISGNSLLGTVPQANLPDPWQAGVSTGSKPIAGSVYITHLKNAAGITGNSLYGRVHNWSALSEVTAALGPAKQGMEVFVMLTSAQKGGNTIVVVPTSTDTLVGVTSTYSTGASAMVLSGVTLEHFLVLTSWMDGYWHLTGASGLSYRNKT